MREKINKAIENIEKEVENYSEEKIEDLKKEYFNFISENRKENAKEIKSFEYLKEKIYQREIFKRILKKDKGSRDQYWLIALEWAIYRENKEIDEIIISYLKDNKNDSISEVYQ